MVHLKWLLVTVIACGITYGYAWVVRPNPAPPDCVRALDLGARIEAATEQFLRPPAGLWPPDVRDIQKLRAERDVAAIRCRDSAR